MVLSDFRQTSVEMAIVVENKRGITKELIGVTCDYVFGYCGLKRVTAFTSPENKPSIMLIKRMGFKQEGIQRSAAPGGGDLLMFGILKEECRFYGIV